MSPLIRNDNKRSVFFKWLTLIKVFESLYISVFTYKLITDLYLIRENTLYFFKAQIVFCYPVFTMVNTNCLLFRFSPTLNTSYFV